MRRARPHVLIVEDDHDVRRISDAWIRTRRCKNNEIRFLIRPMIVDYREGTRYFYAYRDDEAVGFVFFDPLYRDGRLAGYVPNISRSSANFRQGLWYALMAHALGVFREVGVQYVDLGLVPLQLDGGVEPATSEIVPNLTRRGVLQTLVVSSEYIGSRMCHSTLSGRIKT